MAAVGLNDGRVTTAADVDDAALVSGVPGVAGLGERGTPGAEATGAGRPGRLALLTALDANSTAPTYTP